MDFDYLYIYTNHIIKYNNYIINHNKQIETEYFNAGNF